MEIKIPFFSNFDASRFMEKGFHVQWINKIIPEFNSSLWNLHESTIWQKVRFSEHVCLEWKKKLI